MSEKAQNDSSLQENMCMFLAALSSSKSLLVRPLVGWLVGPSTFVKMWPLDY